MPMVFIMAQRSLPDKALQTGKLKLRPCYVVAATSRARHFIAFAPRFTRQRAAAALLR